MAACPKTTEETPNEIGGETQRMERKKVSCMIFLAHQCVSTDHPQPRVPIMKTL